jgi:hypothetical protein
MHDDYKKLFEASEDARQKQEVIITKQNKYISELESKNNVLSTSYAQLSPDYDKTLSICNRQQTLLDQVFHDSVDN